MPAAGGCGEQALPIPLTTNRQYNTMRKKTYVLFTLALMALACSRCHHAPETIAEAPAFRPDKINVDPTGPSLSPEQSMKTMHLPAGYHLELVASEPMIDQPVAIAWDGDGRMYVAEMRTYMLDVDGTDENLPASRILRLEDTDGDGRMDKKTVFIDSLVLPRMILPLDDRLVVNETYTYNLFSYRDTDGDGRADEKTLVYANDARDTRNLEHQKSGLVWNIDNWIYVTSDKVRYRYTDGRLAVDTLEQNPGGQWGLAKDNYGRMYFSSAGGEVPALNFQQNPVYGRLDLKGEREEGFDAVWPVTGTPDVQGGLKRVRPDSTLNHFTACNGQSIFRGDRLPANLQGNLFICEPVGRLIRRALVTDQDGKIILKNAYDSAEFLASTDMNFRPVNTATGPDGCMYIVDMYHGIIQESNWTREGSYLRPHIQRLGLDKNIGMGRIYRLVHDGYARGPQPHLLEASSAELVKTLNHPNGWWRDMAQQLLVLRGDSSAVPALKQLARGESGFWARLAFWKPSPTSLARIHALWTLDGLHAMDKATLLSAFQAEDPQVRKAAVWISEPYIRDGDEEILHALSPLAVDSSMDVRYQLSLSLRSGQGEEAQRMLAQLEENNKDNEVISASWTRYQRARRARSLEAKIAGMKEEDKRLVRRGAMIFSELCATCHGPEGQGTSTMVAPPLAGQPRVNGDEKVLIKILLQGLSGPVDGKTYPDVMPPMASNNDEWIASVLSYIRHDMGNDAPVVTPESVKRVRSRVGGRKSSWTIDELEK